MMPFAFQIPYDRKAEITNAVKEAFIGYIGNEEAVYAIKRVIKVTLHPVRHQHLIDMIDAAPNKSRLIVNALEGRPATPKPETMNKDDEMREQLADFLM